MDKKDEEYKKKQQLLKNEILDRGYDPDEFIDFCLNAKKEGDDLNNWEYDELQKKIQEFINKVNEKYLKESKEEKPETNLKEETINTSNEIIPTPIKQIKCKILMKNYLNDKKLEITIDKPTLIKKNILSESYIIYHLKTSIIENINFSYKVQRKYSDFIQLREILSKFFPFNYIPSLPKKSEEYILSKKTNQNKNISHLLKFITNIINKEEFIAFEGVNNFLTIEDYEEYKESVKNLILNKPPSTVCELRSFNGLITLEDISPNYTNEDYINDIFIDENKNEVYFFNLKNYFEIQTKLIIQLKSHLKEFNSNLNKCYSNLDQIEKDFGFLVQLNNKVKMKNEVTTSFYELGLFFQGWKEIINKQNNLVKQNIKNFYKYIINESGSYFELIKKREIIKNNFSIEYKKINDRKEKLWKSEDVKNWGIDFESHDIDNALLFKDKKYAKSKMLYKESVLSNNLQNDLEYINYTNKKELKNFLEMFLKEFKNNLQNFVKEFYPTLNDFISTWSNLSVNIN